MDWLNDPAVQEAEGFLKRGVTSDGVIPQQDILSYARAVAVPRSKTYCMGMREQRRQRKCGREQNGCWPSLGVQSEAYSVDEAGGAVQGAECVEWHAARCPVVAA